ncbi:MAG: caspase family protein, partial [Alphaproteobacteria bacterium]|nr:caspase family protein [Alphaproteobacteria bacterium]
MLRVVSLALVLIALALPAAAAQRLALVIGNDGYDEVPALLKAVSDAEAVSGTLDDQGFEVITVLDAPRREMNRRISEFTGRLQPGDTALVFFAGHGVEIDGENYLLPTDIVAPTSGDRDFIKGESIALSRLLDRVRATGARTTIAIIDACRDNPFEASTGRSIGGTRGLGRIAAPEGTFVMFSAGAGQLALDRLSDADTDANSVFTRALLPRLRQPGLELRDLVSDLRVEVRDLARTQNHAQFPAYYDELLGSFYFNPASSAPEEAVAEAPAPTPAPAPQSSIRADFELARGLGTVAAYEAFLARYADQSDDFTVLLAQSLLDELKGTEEVAALPPQTPETPAPAPEAAPDPRAIMRETQA